MWLSAFIMYFFWGFGFFTSSSQLAGWKSKSAKFIQQISHSAATDEITQYAFALLQI